MDPLGAQEVMEVAAELGHLVTVVVAYKLAQVFCNHVDNDVRCLV